MTSACVRIIGAVLCALLLAACAKDSAALSLLPVAPSARTAAIAAASSGYKSLYLFKGDADGATPFAGLTPLNGKLYGVTYGDKLGAAASGTVFEVSTSGKERVLYRFRGQPDGDKPAGKLIAVGNVLYGTTFQGGAYDFGSVFSVTPSGREHVIYSFKTLDDAQLPAAGLIDVNGMLYGTATQGGAKGYGAVFEVSPSGRERVLYSFKGYSENDGSAPYGSLISLNNELFGTTEYGGTPQWGTVFAVDVPSGKERIVHTFQGPPNDGGSPESTLIETNGMLYGTTFAENGTVFEISPSSGKERIVYAFKGGPTDGTGPAAAVTAVSGVLYGTTERGGANEYGTIFKTTTTGREQLLYSFKGPSKDGANPVAAMTDVNGVLYGTTVEGGVESGGQPFPYDGSIFRFGL